jgi:hypothetical protein
MQTHQCRQCSKTFRIEDRDLEFYQKLNVPQPTHCPDCRQQRRLAWRNEHALYQRNCDLCQKGIISIYQPDSPFTVYCHDCWWSERWNALDYGQAIDFKRPFFEQWNELQLKVPKIALYAADNEQSEYVNMTGYSKGCYLVFAGDYDEDCMYSTQIIKSVSCVDTLNCIESEDCYEVVDVERCYRLFWSQNCKHCTDSMFLFDCRGCTDCLFSTNLRNQRYYIFNKQYSPEAYHAKKQQIMAEIQAGKLPELLQHFQDICMQAIHRPLEQANSETVSGDYIFNSHQAAQCYDVTGIDQCAYVYTAFHVKDLMDVCHTTDVELAYEGTSIGYQAYHCLFVMTAWTVTDCFYSSEIFHSNNLFGCVGLSKQKFCILNKQYSEADYHQLRDQLIAHMQQTGEWGEFFPMRLSPFAYNESMAQVWYPYTQEQTKNQDLVWYEQPAQQQAAGVDVLNCQLTGKPYRVIPQERAWYQRLGLPIPSVCPEERRRLRFLQRNPRQLWQRQCMCTQTDHGHHGRCATEFATTYAPERKELVYCESCYQQEVI